MDAGLPSVGRRRCAGGADNTWPLWMPATPATTMAVTAPPAAPPQPPANGPAFPPPCPFAPWSAVSVPPDMSTSSGAADAVGGARGAGGGTPFQVRVALWRTRCRGCGASSAGCGRPHKAPRIASWLAEAVGRPRAQRGPGRQERRPRDRGRPRKFGEVEQEEVAMEVEVRQEVACRAPSRTPLRGHEHRGPGVAAASRTIPNVTGAIVYADGGSGSRRTRSSTAILGQATLRHPVVPGLGSTEGYA